MPIRLEESLPLIILFGFGMWLSIIDIQQHRLPNRIVAIFSAVLCATEISLDPDRFLKSIQIASLTIGFYALLYVASRKQLGMGDVKYSFSIGLVVGWYVPEHWVLGVILAFVLAGLFSMVGIISGQLRVKSYLAFGPFMTLGALIVVCYDFVKTLF